MNQKSNLDQILGGSGTLICESVHKYIGLLHEKVIESVCYKQILWLRLFLQKGLTFQIVSACSSIYKTPLSDLFSSRV
jgi:hypothetical protein